jgi:hypothetical protein
LYLVKYITGLAAYGSLQEEKGSITHSAAEALVHVEIRPIVVEYFVAGVLGNVAMSVGNVRSHVRM